MIINYRRKVKKSVQKLAISYLFTKSASILEYVEVRLKPTNLCCSPVTTNHDWLLCQSAICDDSNDIYYFTLIELDK